MKLGISRFSIVLPLVLLYLHATLFGGWIVDDSGISYAYARSLADGYGLVSQPGMMPVEGYSNTLWVLFLALLMVVGVFDPIWTPKVVSLLLVTIAFVLIHRELRQSFSNSASIFALTLLSMQTGFVVWVVSGLENGLLVFLMAYLISTLLSVGRTGLTRVSTAVLAITAFGIAMTRPEGVIYACAVPLFLVLHGHPVTSRRTIVRASLSFCVLFTVLMLGFLLFRILYFGDFLPNVFYAKGGISLSRVLELFLLQPGGVIKAHHLFSSIFGNWLALWGLVGLVGLVVLLTIRLSRFPDTSESHLTAYLFLELMALSFIAFLLLPYDWMSEFRFATVFFIAIYPLLAGSIWMALRKVAKSSSVIWPVVVLVLLGVTLSTTVVRTRIFRASPTISIAEVTQSGQRYNDYSRIVGNESSSIMVADVGGLLWAGEHKIFDLGMLTDLTIARTIGEWRTDPDYESFYDYVFNTTMPDFISTRAYHSWRANLHGDDRFKSLYVPIVEYEDSWIIERYGAVYMSGDYVRRDYVQVQPGKLQELRRAAAKYHFFGCRDCPKNRSHLD